MPRKASHGWSFGQQKGSRPYISIKSSGLKKTRLSSDLGVKKKIFLQREQIEFLLERFDHLEDLVSGKIAPQNKAGERFIKVAKGSVNASTKYEKAYLYMKQYKISLSQLKGKLKEMTLAGNKQETANNSFARNTEKSNLTLSQRARRGLLRPSQTIEEKTPKPNPVPKVDRSQIPGAGLATEPKNYVRKVSEPLGTREDYKRDRASWKRGGA